MIKRMVAVLILMGGLEVVQGQEPPLLQPPTATQPPVEPQQAAEPAVVISGDHAGDPRTRKQPVRTVIHNRGYFCGTDPFFPGCSSLRDELRFIFGSCRSFFGEPCFPKPPRPGQLRKQQNSLNGPCCDR